MKVFCRIITTIIDIQAQTASEGKDLFLQKKYSAAAKTLQQAVNQDESDTVALFYLGRSLLALEQYDEAIEPFKQLVRLHPDNASFNYWTGVAYRYQLTSTNNPLEQGILASKTKQYFQQAVELDPTNVDAKISLANYYINAPAIAGGSKRKALALADEVQILDAVSAHQLRANIYRTEQKYDLAAQEYEALTKIVPTERKPMTAYNMGFMYQTAKQFDSAFVAFEQAIKLNENLYRAYYQYARTAVFSKKNVAQGIKYLEHYLKNTEKLRENDVQPSGAHWRLGMLYEIKGDKAAAKKHYEQALALDPNNDNARKSLEALE